MDVLLAMALVALAAGSVVGGTLAVLKAAYRARDLHMAGLAAREKAEELRGLPDAALRGLAAAAGFGGDWTEGGFTPAVGAVVYHVYVAERSDAAARCPEVAPFLPTAPSLFRASVTFRRGGQDFFTETVYLRPAGPGS